METIKPLRIIVSILLFSTMHIASAFATGPSDSTSAAPPAGTADKIICSGQNISITGPQDSTAHDYASYQWYKLNAAGVAQLTSTTTRTYTEATNGKGYYNYKVVTVNAGGCTSPMSDVFKIYVLPPITATITTSSATNTICSNGQSSIVLTATPSNPSAYTYTYQWTRNGVNIAGATSNTYTLTEQTSGSVTIGVNINYTLNNACTASATQIIIVSPVPAKPTITW